MSRQPAARKDTARKHAARKAVALEGMAQERGPDMDDTDTAILPGLVDDAVDEPAPDSDLAAALAAAAPRCWFNRTTLVLGGLVLLVGGFLGGVQAQQHWGVTTPAAGTGRNGGFAGFPGGFAGNAGRGGTPGSASGGATAPGAASGGAASDTTTGTVKLVDGTTLYVQTSGGDTVTVKTDGATKVRTTQPGSLKKLKAGQKVAVQGSAPTDGTIAATTVTVGG